MTTANTPADAAATEHAEANSHISHKGVPEQGRAHPAGQCAGPAMPAL